ncbi:MAG: hypothetical protein ACYTGW_20870 [Planctomycetota bacterium]|jgi:hypothetical protein
MQAVDLDTILLPEDFTNSQQLCCLSCRRRLAGLALTDQYHRDGVSEVTLSISLLSEELRDFQQSPDSIRLSCGCGVRSTFHIV